MFWAGEPPAATLETLSNLGFRCGQLAIPGNLELDSRTLQAWKKALADAHFTVYTVFAAFEGESYADIPAVKRTVGFIPPVTREVRELRMLEVSDFAAQLGVRSIATHIGFVPEDTNHPDYLAVREMVRRVCDHALSHQQTFALETGQERADVLLSFLLDVNRRNLAINFDPANMILYGTGALGTEQPLGKGAVDLKGFLSALKGIGYRGPLAIERETEDKEARLRDIAEGKKLLEELIAI